MFFFYQEAKEYQLCKEKFEQVGLIPFMKNFKGYHEGVSHSLIQSYDGEYVN